MGAMAIRQLALEHHAFLHDHHRRLDVPNTRAVPRSSTRSVPSTLPTPRR